MMRRISATLIFVFMLGIPFAFGASIHGRYRTPRRSLHRTRTHVARWNPVLRGSHDSMLRQNEEIDRLKLTRINNDQELEELELRGELVNIHESKSLRLASNLEFNRRFCRPWTRAFLEDLSEAFYQQFHQPIQVTSAVRTVDQQARLQLWNRNAAPIYGDTASSHLAGLTVDIGKGPMSRKQRAWFDRYVLKLQQLGLVEAAEERRQACYHIMVSSRYDEYRTNLADSEAPR
ncbi:MAG: hypothetical protein CXZ00_02785 [Acidobacteria bacterium]|nr:MAG: hypothetical protein CXZ00_02785 [Acidobacteriota bacterium]